MKQHWYRGTPDELKEELDKMLAADLVIVSINPMSEQNLHMQKTYLIMYISWAKIKELYGKL